MKIFLLFLITHHTLQKITKTPLKFLLKFDRTLQKMPPSVAMSTITQYKDQTGKSPKITFKTLKSLINSGHKKQIRNLFLKNAIEVLTSPYLTEEPEESDFSQIGSNKSILALMGIPMGIVLGTKNPLSKKIYEKEKGNLEAQVSRNYMMKLNRKGTIGNVDTQLGDLEAKFDSVANEVQNKVFTLKAVTEVHFKHEGVGMINN